jgi:hypothetical protein
VSRERRQSWRRRHRDFTCEGSRPGRSLSAVRYRVTLVPLLGLVLITLAAFAHANPPDQTWLPGIYDDADFDDVVARIVSWSGTTPESPAGSLGPLPVATAAVTFVEPGDLPPRCLRPDATRSPPSS